MFDVGLNLDDGWMIIDVCDDEVSSHVGVERCIWSVFSRLRCLKCVSVLFSWPEQQEKID